MDAMTQAYYNGNAENLARTYADCQGGISEWFETAFPQETKVLDVGAGSGRDLDRLLNGGWDAHGVEPCQAFIKEAENRYPRVRDRITPGGLPDLEGVVDQTYDGILCSAVLMHLPEAKLFDAAFGLRRILKPGGRLLVSLPTDSLGNPVRERDDKGRLFSGLSPDRLELLLSRLCFSCIGRSKSTDSLGRTEREWVTQLFVLETDGSDRSITRIESVLNRNHSRVATYNLALFRALAEIGMTQYNRVRWLPVGRVGLPIRALAEKWLEYYWPIVASETFIPQLQGAAPNSIKHIAFRALLAQLAGRFRSKGGLSGFLLTLRSGNLTGEESSLYKKALTRICDTIKVSPLHQAGGEGPSPALFQYDGKSRSIVMDRALWQEFCLMGPWVRDATILRWAELTQHLSKHEITTGQVLELLLEEPLPEWVVHDARELFLKNGKPACVWTGERLEKKGFDVDHAIPFSIWHNNDLWNLFPVKGAVNRSKADKLPRRRLILGRKANILDIWERFFDAYPQRFRAETATFAGADITRQDHWPERLFDLFSEAVEITAIQRGVERWEP